VALSFTSAYASYYLSEEVFGASGMLAVVFNGFTLSIIGAAGPPDPL
jgi:NhaP-type Na+/H+ or K+/H+ antiporter